MHNTIHAFFGKNGTKLDAGKVGSGVYDPAHFCLPKCFRIRSGKFTGSVTTNSDLFDLPRAACAESPAVKLRMDLCSLCPRQAAPDPLSVMFVQSSTRPAQRNPPPPLPTHFLCGICTGCHRYRKSPPSTSTSTTVSSMISTRASFAGKQKVKKVGRRWFFSKAAAQQATFKTCSQKDLLYLTCQTATLDWPSLQRRHRKAWLHSL